ncbi:unnamed protein product [Chrysoparadoxa australica]
MSIGSLAMCTSSIYLIKSRWGAQDINSRKKLVIVHWAFNGLGLVSSVGAGYVIWKNKEAAGKPHLTSWHSWIGVLTSLLWLSAAGLAGNKAVDLEGKKIKLLWSSWKHRWVGSAAYFASLVTTISGLRSGWGLKTFGDRGSRGLCVMVAAVGAATLLGGRGRPSKKTK